MSRDMVRRILLICLVAGAALAGGLGRRVGGEQAAAPPGNILLIVVDTLRVDRLSGYGYEAGTTPNIDRLMKRSVVFTNAYSTTNYTTPSFASILTGLEPSRHGVIALDFRDRLDDRIETMPEIARDAGMDTAAISASITFAFCNIRQGFDFFDAGFINGEIPFDWDAHPEIEREYRFADEVTDAALRYLRRIDGAPFFLLVHYYEPHRRDERDRIEEEVGLARAYDLDVRFMDEQFGRLLEGLADLGLAGNTTVVFTADHGENLLDEDPENRGHEDIHHNVLRVPLLFAVPGVAPATREEPVQTTDIFPTVHEWLAAPELPYAPDGRSLVPLLRGRKPEGFSDRMVFFRQSLGLLSDPVVPRHAGLGDGEWRYVARFESLDDREGRKILDERLYHLTEDPRAVNDRLDEFPGVGEAKRDELLEWIGRWSPLYETPVEEEGENVEALKALGYLGG